MREADAIYVGDNWDVSVLGSHHAGLRPVWVQRGAPPDRTRQPMSAIVDTLAALPKVHTKLSARPRFANELKLTNERSKLTSLAGWRHTSLHFRQQQHSLDVSYFFLVPPPPRCTPSPRTKV